MATAIKVESLSKIYRLGEIGTGTISRDIERFVKTRILKQEDPFLKIGETNDRATKGASDIVYSLKDINFEIEQGEAVGIIGRNGAGKSTLLKILSRVTSPTTGKINIKGRVASLLEVGTGFHPELTGRENIYLNGAILGMRKREIDRKLDEIIDYSGVERYIDTPVKRYSSGMYVRLAFAVAAHLESEILIVDEVLAVGDAEFQKKCLGKMKDVSKKEGRTVLFVSHNMASVLSLCTSGIVLKNGIISFKGTSDEGVNLYLADEESNSVLKSFYKKTETDNKEFTILEAFLLDSTGQIKTNFDFSEEIIIRIKYELKKDLVGSIVNFVITKSSKDICMSFDTDNNKELFDKRHKGIYSTQVIIPSRRFKPGTYNIQLNTGLAQVSSIDQIENCMQFEVLDKSKDHQYKSYRSDRRGEVPLDLNWSTELLEVK
jgi:lipopolysaccharide transport system ATP-binding protein